MLVFPTGITTTSSERSTAFYYLFYDSFWKRQEWGGRLIPKFPHYSQVTTYLLNSRPVLYASLMLRRDRCSHYPSTIPHSATGAIEPMGDRETYIEHAEALWAPFCKLLPAVEVIMLCHGEKKDLLRYRTWMDTTRRRALERFLIVHLLIPMFFYTRLPCTSLLILLLFLCHFL